MPRSSSIRGWPGAWSRRSFPRSATCRCRLIGEGWDNTVFAAGDDWVFRFPRREVVLPGLQVEIDVLPLLAALLPVPIPVPEHVGVPSDEFPWPFFGARMLPGVELCEAPETSRDRLARAARPRASRAALARRPRRGRWAPARELDAARRHAGCGCRCIREKLAELDGLLPAPDAGACGCSTTPRPFRRRSRRAVCHGDLHFRHVLVDGGRVTGLIDWIDLCRGDPALDLQLVWSALQPEERDASSPPTATWTTRRCSARGPLLFT